MFVFDVFGSNVQLIWTGMKSMDVEDKELAYHNKAVFDVSELHTCVNSTTTNKTTSTFENVR